MYNSQDGRSARRNVLRSNSYQNGIQDGGSQQQWRVSDGPQYQQQPVYQQQQSYQPQSGAGGASYPHSGAGGSSYPQPGSGGSSYPQTGAGGSSYPQSGSGGASYPQSYNQHGGQNEVEDGKSFKDLRTMFGKPTTQQSQQTGVRINRAGGSGRKPPTFRKPAGNTEIEEPGWIPKNKPPPFSQSRYLPASMRSPPINRRQPQQGGNGYQAPESPAWQGAGLRSSSVPRSWEVQDQPLDQWQSAGRQTSVNNPEPGDSGENHSARFYQLVNENSDQMEHYNRLPQASHAYNTSGHGSQLSAGGSSYY